MLQAVRTRVIPWVVWFGTIAAVVSLRRQVAEDSAIGFAVAVELQVAPIEAGIVEAVQVTVGQRVRAGEIVARLDARAIAAEQAILAAERARLEAEIGAVAADTSLRVGESTREFAEAIASAERALTAARGDRKARAAELRALSQRVHALRDLVDRRMADRRELDALLVEQARLEQEVRRAEGLMQQLAGEAAAARARQALLPSGTTEAAVQPIRAELAVLAGQAELLALRQEEAVLRAPADGVVAQVLRRAGEYVGAGEPVLTIVGDDAGPAPEVQVCVLERAAAAIRPGDPAVLRPRGGEGALAGHVARVGPQIAELPLRCRRDPEVPEYGREVIIALDGPAQLLPGQALGVAFPGGGAQARADAPAERGEDDARAGSARGDARVERGEDDAPAGRAGSARGDAPSGLGEDGATAAAGGTTLASRAGARAGEGSPRELALPAALTARTRFEPSALTWSPARGRYVIVSDDTGTGAGKDEHLPWLFTMDRAGHVDAAPLEVAGIDRWTDLEAIAPGPDGSLYVLASQSRSRKGKRSPVREVFARIEWDGAGARVGAHVRLAQRLADAPAQVRAGLGVADDAELDIEGLTATAAGGLLLGLKGPLDGEGRAIVWHLPRPEVLLAGGSIEAAGLRRFGAVSLAVTADGATRAGGIAELLELPDGALLIAATAAGDDPQHQDGGLWYVGHRDALAEARPIRSFPGLKPEGLALRPDGLAVVVVFDTGAEPPQWIELPWPAAAALP